MKNAEIKLIKLVNGTEVLAKVLNTTKLKLTVEDPIQINYKNINSSVPMVSVTRYLQFANTRTVEFQQKNILHVVDVVEGMQRFYLHSLYNFENTVDKLVDRELAAVVFEDEISNQQIDKSEFYKAFLEKISSDKPLN